jgi:hypothetical protein
MSAVIQSRRRMRRRLFSGGAPSMARDQNVKVLVCEQAALSTHEAQGP